MSDRADCGRKRDALQTGLDIVKESGSVRWRSLLRSLNRRSDARAKGREAETRRDGVMRVVRV